MCLRNCVQWHSLTNVQRKITQVRNISLLTQRLLKFRTIDSNDMTRPRNSCNLKVHSIFWLDNIVVHMRWNFLVRHLHLTSYKLLLTVFGNTGLHLILRGSVMVQSTQAFSPELSREATEVSSPSPSCILEEDELQISEKVEKHWRQ